MKLNARVLIAAIGATIAMVFAAPSVASATSIHQTRTAQQNAPAYCYWNGETRICYA